MTSNRAKVRRWGRIIQAFFGLFLLLFGFYIGKTHFHLIHEGTRVQGTIIGYKEERFRSSSGNSSSVSFMPVVEFRAGNRIVQFEDWLGRRISGNINESVPVIYDSANPIVAMIDRPLWNWIPWAPIFIFGVFLLLVAIKGLVLHSN